MAFMLFLGSLVYIFLVVLHALRAQQTPMSEFELHRRKKLGDRQAAQLLRTQELARKLASLKQAATGVLIVALSAFCIAALGWQKGIVLALVAGVLYGRIARLGAIEKLARRLQKRYEKPALNRIEHYPIIVKLFGAQIHDAERSQTFGSREELFHSIATSHGVFSDEDTTLLAGALTLRERQVGEAMTKRGAVTTVAADELLGPLVLSDLYKTGHMCFPVVRGDIDHVIGLLDIRSLLTLESELSVTAMGAMTTEIVSVAASESLYTAAMLFLRSSQQLLLVTNEDGSTAGVLHLNTILQALLDSR